MRDVILMGRFSGAQKQSTTQRRKRKNDPQRLSCMSAAMPSLMECW
jgi:hypothetical protein